MDKDLLEKKLTDLGLSNRDYSILGIERPDCFHILSSGKDYLVYYIDDRGNKLYESTFYSFSLAAEYLLLLIKSMI